MGSSPFARTLLRDRGVFPGLFFCACGSCLEKRSGSRGFVPLCHCVTSPWGEWKRLSPFRSLARFLEIEELFPGLFFLRLREESWKMLRASRSCTPLSLRDISRGRMETSVAVSVARTLFRDRGVFPGLFFVACGSCLEKRSIQVLRKRARRCGRGRHGRPWPCEWDVGREPDRDERSEPPTAAPPPGAIQTLK